ncbi:MAG: BolA/IbaG family iron-sulfur metabolism protein [Thiomicrorhabdus chilensis]|uniref:BolA family protein n=1 Tax=Thiomicrorhabdus chilensis TaxID=63656 RepID=UPI00299E9B75|nr:BolA/IbaG family iron-sulfur metabolism protein [Thiomicrorhabdus chilensis]MDX1347326.1 BolA/IbaG family iron-sulfur metabolism protein [Thiomicrorhabdus chilensis]
MLLQPQIEAAIQKDFNVFFMELLNESHMHAGPAAESHFKLTLVSDDFKGIGQVKRQQAVYRVLKELMPQFHALALHTYSFEEWEQVQKAPASPRCTGGH